MTTPQLFPRMDRYDVRGAPLEFKPPSTWLFRLPRELRPQNATMWGRWGGMRRERQKWEHEFTIAANVYAITRVLWPSGDEASQWRDLFTCNERRRVAVIRLVPHSRNLIRDDGNLRGCDKHLVDAMTRVGLIRDDARGWCEHVEPTQAVHPDGEFLTLVQLSRPDVRGAWKG